ncbi:MAG TPA: S9 family peptidase [Steroidobacteraceae bacterium]|nr:S9 family peptidase [Steroidobacteraceae bacterium]
MITRLAGVLGALLLAVPGFARPLAAEDFYRVQRVSDPHISPDGAWVVYTLNRALREEDKSDSDIWLASWNGTESIQLTNTTFAEHSPRWSPDGKWIAFLTDRGDAKAGDQIWVLNRAGGEAKQLTHFGSEITSFAWAPDGKRIAFTAVVTPEEQADSDKPQPIVLDRLQFKSDDDGYLRGERTHLFLLDVTSGETTQLTDGPYDELQPSWSPDGTQIAFLSKRGDDPDSHNNWDLYIVVAHPEATPRQLTTNPGTDGDPTEDWGSRPPTFSGDGTQVAYVAAGKPEDLWYSLVQVSVTPATGGEATLPLAKLDRQSFDPLWSADGKWLYFRLEDDGSITLARIRLRDGKLEQLTQPGAVVSEFDVRASASAGRRARNRFGAPHIVTVWESVDHPAELVAVERDGRLRQITHHNDEWLAEVSLAPARAIQFKSADDTVIHGLLMIPVDGSMAGRAPTLVRLHGGPVSQHQFDFDFEWQLLAANGYVIVGPNPRGSSGRGYEFQKALFGNFGTVDVPDVLAAADYVVTVGIADPQRLGIGGWSYGAILTNYVIAADTRFKAATSGAGMGNMLAGYGDDQYVREWELELGLPWEKTESWLRVSSPFLHADRITTPTLFLVGSEDRNVPPIGAEQMYQALRRLHVPTQLVIYPGERHGFSRPSFRVDRVERYVEWYGRYLKSN